MAEPYDIRRGKRLGAFGTDFGGYLELWGDWIPEAHPDDAAALMMNVAGYYENTRVPLLAARQAAMQDTQRRFDTETTPDDEPWVRLKREYLRYKLSKGYPGDILHREGYLESAATSSKAWKVIGPNLVFDANVLPKGQSAGWEGFNYGAFHQGWGSTTGERKPHRTAATFGEFIPHKGYEQTGEETIAGVPPRPFIGISWKGVTAIEAIFADWFSHEPETITSFHRIGGGVQPIVRTPMGPRFGSMPAQGM